jgi:hypothetical protein
LSGKKVVSKAAPLLSIISNTHLGAIEPRLMNLFIYIPTKEIPESQLMQLIEKRTPQFQVETFRSIEDFKVRLVQPRFKFTVAIVFAPNRQDISDILSLEHCLRDIQIILIISHENHGTLSMAHFLRPRFISYFSYLSNEIDTGEIIPVLQKMLENQISCHYTAKTYPSG